MDFSFVRAECVHKQTCRLVCRHFHLFLSEWYAHQKKRRRKEKIVTQRERDAEIKRVWVSEWVTCRLLSFGTDCVSCKSGICILARFCVEMCEWLSKTNNKNARRILFRFERRTKTNVCTFFSIRFIKTTTKNEHKQLHVPRKWYIKIRTGIIQCDCNGL